MKNYKKLDEILIIPCKSALQNTQQNADAAMASAAYSMSKSASSSAITDTSGSMATYSNGSLGIYAGTGDSCVHWVSVDCDRMYMTLSLPELTRNPRIKRAELVFTQCDCEIEEDSTAKLALYELTSEIVDGGSEPTSVANPMDIARARYPKATEDVRYSFDVTDMIERIYRGESECYGVKLAILASSCSDQISLYGSTANSNFPELHITYESSYGTDTDYRVHTHDIGSFCKGSIDLACGNLMLKCEDITWAGVRMPVSISHLYNSALSDVQYTSNAEVKLNTADFSAMKIGCGFRLDIMQSMCYVSTLPFDIEDEDKSGYVYVDERGSEVYFKKSGTLYEDIEGGGMSYDPETRILSTGSEKYRFDSAGRLVAVADEHDNTRTVTYTAGVITKVTDGAGREFVFEYTNGYLSKITAPDGSCVSYQYTDGYLSLVTFPDNREAVFAYTDTRLSSVILYDSEKHITYRVTYSYLRGKVYRVTEYGVENGAYVAGSSTTYSYSSAANRTTVTTTEQADAAEGDSTANEIKTVYTFDVDGHVVSEYSYSVDTGNVGAEVSGSGINPIPDNMGYSAPVVNLLSGHRFDSLDAWTAIPSNDPDISISILTGNQHSKHGRSTLRMISSNTDAKANGLYQTIPELPAGEYTFSAYIRCVSVSEGADAGVYLRVTDANGAVLCESERTGTRESEHVRFSTSFTLQESKTVNVQLLACGKCGAYIDSAQLERGSYAGEYNQLTNGSFFSDISGWTGAGERVAGVSFDSAGSLLIRGDADTEKKVYQDIPVKAYADTRETFTLSGWVRNNGIPTREREELPETAFRLFAEVHYTDGSTDEQIITADGCYAVTDWHYVSCDIAKKQLKPADFIRVGCEYSYNFGTAYFDGLTLTRTGIETGLTADDFAEYDDDIEVTESTADTDTADTEDTAPAFEELTDSFGNALTETVSNDGEFGSIYRAFDYSENGNDLIRETDARGNTTEYTVDGVTSRNEIVTDRMGNKTEYEYDEAGRTTKVTSVAAIRDANGNPVRDSEGNIQYEVDPEAHVSYSYDTFDNMTEIVRGDGMKYVLSYNAYHNLESIGIDGKSDGSLVTYAYKAGNGRLKEVTYANGDRMKATYNSIGQMIAERWFDVNNTLTAYYKYTYDTQGNIVRSIDMTAEKEYNYTYECGTLIRSAEYDITVDNELVTTKTLVSSVRYSYDSEGTLTKKRVKLADGTEQVIYCETNDGNTVVKFTAGEKSVTSHSKTDSFGRKVFDELQLGTGFVSRQFAYFAGDIPEEHKTAERYKYKELC